MSNFQTEIQTTEAIRLGSCKFEIAPYSETPAFVNLGAMKNVKMVEQIEFVTIEPDNAPPIKKVKSHKAIITGDWQEPTLAGIAAMRGDFDTLTTVAGTDTLDTGGMDEIDYIIVRLTNTNAATKTYQYTVHKCQVTKGIEQAFGADSALTPAAIPLEITGELDLSKTRGEQLMQIVDMQAPTTPAA